MNEQTLSNANPLCPLCNIIDLGKKNDLLFCDGCEMYVGSPDTYEKTFGSQHIQSLLRQPISHHEPGIELTEAFVFWFALSFVTFIVSIEAGLFV
ncbi:MAG: hypothetical protein AAB783_02015 [Patescibacteria group bacterium]